MIARTTWFPVMTKDLWKVCKVLERHSRKVISGEVSFGKGKLTTVNENWKLVVFEFDCMMIKQLQFVERLVRQSAPRQCTRKSVVCWRRSKILDVVIEDGRVKSQKRFQIMKSSGRTVQLIQKNEDLCPTSFVSKRESTCCVEYSAIAMVTEVSWYWYAVPILSGSQDPQLGQRVKWMFSHQRMPSYELLHSPISAIDFADLVPVVWTPRLSTLPPAHRPSRKDPSSDLPFPAFALSMNDS